MEAEEQREEERGSEQGGCARRLRRAEDDAAALSQLDGWGTAVNLQLLSPLECRAQLETRDWAVVRRFLSACVAADAPDALGDAVPQLRRLQGSRTVQLLSPPAAASERGRFTYVAELRYCGTAFSGYEWQPTRAVTVEATLQAALASLPLEAASQPRISAAGRTDAGVSATGQLVSFYLRAPLDSAALRRAVAAHAPAPGTLAVAEVATVPRAFHATYSALWRRYVYLLPAMPGEDAIALSERMNALLQPLGGRELDLFSFARDTPAGSSTVCIVHRARAFVAAPPSSEPGVRFICVDLAANRFLRRLVRVLVATCVREALGGAPEGALLHLANLRERRATAPPAPAEGLCFAEVGLTPFRSLEQQQRQS